MTASERMATSPTARDRLADSPTTQERLTSAPSSLDHLMSNDDESLCKAPEQTLTKPKDVCSAPLDQAQAKWDEKGLISKIAHPDAYRADIARARVFQRDCEALPDKMPASAITNVREQLAASRDGVLPSPEESLRLRDRLRLLQDTYQPGDRLEAPLSPAERNVVDRKANDFDSAILPVPFGALGPAARALGADETAVRRANELGWSIYQGVQAHVLHSNRVQRLTPGQ